MSATGIKRFEKMQVATGGRGWCHYVLANTPHYKDATLEQLVKLTVVSLIGPAWHMLPMLADDRGCFFMLEFGDRKMMTAVLKGTMNCAINVAVINENHHQRARVLALPEDRFALMATSAEEKVETWFILPRDPDELFGALAASVVREDLPMRAAPAARPSERSTCDNCSVALVRIRTCSLCKFAVYCGAECQKAHWRAVHKRECTRVEEVRIIL